MKRKTPALFSVLAVFLIVVFFLQPSVFSGVDEKLDKSWQHLGVKRQFSEPLGFEEAMVWHLDFNGFAVRLPGCLMVFDYDNEVPASQQDKKSDIGIVESLLTGVINPEEIKNEKVVFFFSHEHPAEKILKLLPWKDRIKDVMFVIPEEVYLKHEDEIKELDQKNSVDLNKKSVLSVIKLIKPDHTYPFMGNVVVTPRQRAVLDFKMKSMYPGVEFIVQTSNGLTVYHSGSLMCRHCSDLKTILAKGDEELSKPPGVQSRIISRDAKKLRFVDGKMVAVESGEEDSDNAKGVAGMYRLGMAVYSNPQKETGRILMYATVGETLGIIKVHTTSQVGPNFNAASKARNKDYLMETDKFITGRNPAHDAKLHDAAWLELRITEINEYFEKMSGNLDVLLTLRNTAIKRYAAYCAKVKEYCGPGVPRDECDKKVEPNLHGGNVEEVDYYEPSILRGESVFFTTIDGPAPGSVINHQLDFLGYFTSEGSEGYPLFASEDFLYKLFKECGN